MADKPVILTEGLIEKVRESAAYVFSESCDHTGQAIDYMVSLLHQARGTEQVLVPDEEKTSAVDSNVEALRELLLNRAAVGLKKYGVTTERTDLSLRDWLQHALEEVLDQAVYLQAAIRKIDTGE